MEIKTSINFNLEYLDKIEQVIDIMRKAGWEVYDIKTFTLKKPDGTKEILHKTYHFRMELNV